MTTPSTAVSYTSDARNLRQSRTVGGATQQFTWSSVGALPLLLDDGEHSYVYGPSSTPLAQVDDATGLVQYLHSDLLGTPRLVTDSAGSQVGTVSFGAFGSVAAQSGVQSPFGFTGNWADPDTGLLYLRARDYDPSTGQFLTVDPLVDQTRQPYAYTGNSPVSRTDPSGQIYVDPNSWWIGLLGAVLPTLPSDARTLIGINNDVEAGVDLVSALVMNLNPVYSILEGISNAIRDTENGCEWYVVAADYAQAALGLLATVGISAGGVGLLRVANPAGLSIRSINWTDDTGSIGWGTPRTNVAQNKQFNDAIKDAERQIGRPLSKDERTAVHREISGQGYGYHEIVSEVLSMFG